MRWMIGATLAGMTACSSNNSNPSGAPDAASTDTTEPTEHTSGPFDGAPLADLSSGDCPDLSTAGTKTFESNGKERTLVVEYPDELNPSLPVLFVWHGLGDSAEGMNAWMGLSSFARDNDIIVILPDSQDRLGETWNVTDPDGDDAVLYDDIRTCLSQEHQIDLSSVTSTGFSFGGLFTTFLTMVRSDSLATTLPMSGGTDPFWLTYQTPSNNLPVLVMWGGETDTYGSGPFAVDFEATSLDFSASLQADGHFVVNCDHGGGHTVPFDIHDVMRDWLLPHTFGGTSPYADGDLSSFPQWCSIP